MPLSRIIVSDLYQNRVRGFGAKPDQGGAARDVVLPGMSHIKEFYDPVTISVTANVPARLSCVPAPLATANGMYLHYDADYSTVVSLTRPQRVVASGNYSGCLYSVYYAGGGVFKCVHTSRPLNETTNLGDEKYVKALREYAIIQMNWILIQEIPTRGLHGVGGCESVGFVTRVSYNINPVVVRTVRLAYDSNGLSVQRDRWETPCNYP